MAAPALFARQVNIWKSNLVGEERRQLMVTAARAARDEALAQDAAVLGAPPPYQTIVDGRDGAAEETVRPGGTIVYLFAVGAVSLEQAVDETYRLLLELSPRLTGHYAGAHQMLINDVPTSVAAGAAALSLGAADVVSFVNLLPYSRRIEKGWSTQAPNGVYEAAATVAASRFGKVVKIAFSYETYQSAPAVGVTRKGGPLRTRADFDRARRYPTITLTVK